MKKALVDKMLSNRLGKLKTLIREDTGEGIETVREFFTRMEQVMQSIGMASDYDFVLVYNHLDAFKDRHNDGEDVTEAVIDMLEREVGELREAV